MKHMQQIFLIACVVAAVEACTGQDKSEAVQAVAGERNNVAASEAQRESVSRTVTTPMGTGQILVKFREGTDAATIERIGREAGLRVIKVVSPPYLVLMSIADGSSVDDAMARLKAYPEVLYSEPNYTRSLKGD